MRNRLALVVAAALLEPAQAQDFAAPVPFPTVGAPYAVALADLDGDGRLDAVAALRELDQVAVLLGSAPGPGLGPPSVFLTGADRPVAIATGDLDGDGDVDVVTVNEGAPHTVALLGVGGGALGPPRIGPAIAAPSEVALADLDGDGVLDLVVGTSVPALHFRRGVGNGTFEATGVDLEVPRPAPFDSIVDLALGDLDDDGRTDVVAASFSAATQIAMNASQPGVLAFDLHTQHGWWGYLSHGVDLADADEDGVLDLFWVEDDGVESGGAVRSGVGDGTFEFFGVEAFYEVDFVRFATLDTDVDPDLVAVRANPFGPAELFVRHGGPGLDVGLPTMLPFTAHVADVEVGDLQGDGFDDVVVADSQTGRLLVFADQGCPAAGQVTFASPAAVPSIASPPSTLVLDGCNLHTVTSVTVGGAALIPAPFTVSATGDQVVVTVPQALPLGGSGVQVIGSGGPIASFAISIVAPAAPVLALVPPGNLSVAAPSTLHVGGGNGDLVLLFVSPALVPSTLPGVVDLAIGNGFASLFLLATPVVGPPSSSVALPLAPPMSLLGATLHLQAAVLDASAPSLPLLATGALSVTVGP